MTAMSRWRSMNSFKRGTLTTMRGSVLTLSTPGPAISALHERDRLDLDPGAADQPHALERRARRRIGREVFVEHRVHLHQLREIDHVDGDLDDLVERRARRLKHGFQVLADLARLRRDAADGELAGARVVAELPGREDPLAPLDRLRERHASRWNLIGVDDLLGHVAPHDHCDTCFRARASAAISASVLALCLTGCQGKAGELAHRRATPATLRR